MFKETIILGYRGSKTFASSRLNFSFTKKIAGLICSFRSKVLVKVDPAQDVMEAERNIKALLSAHHFYNMIAEPEILNIEPVGA